ncbi:phosphate ABC transporter substrate-binding protein [Vulcanococcus limneticus Candia 3F8]|uniref:phosphate ABC transporter substrate-binding protein n=1 Tax=Vulcanococcus limneticus TaxID=2170428 RepID=UPI000B991941|nr:phosphate ABC transporter substrate-binding protein [Vulcanococcus limneticus]MCP9792567.1 phosphate ABC transporter substrate-binding protein [Vulcanococcus limneticus MW73D5]MCP9894198.1 phosphate ABC transporter substrate-binding protein [Vulcanococcus limneticus Candia 3F8]MCP9897959.1 phosphate ABC transporter substrate-binding protein [Vulcanococcus limneticus Candia 3B3]
MSQQSSGGQRSGPPPIVFIALALADLWLLQSQWSKLKAWQPSIPSLPSPPSIPAAGGGQATDGALKSSTLFPLQASVPAGTKVSLDGSTSMVLINEALKAGFLKTYPDSQVETAATGSDNGIQALLVGNINLAAISRPLTSEEKGRGLRAVPVAKDRIAIVVGVANPFRRGLSRSQLVQIFRGEITNWATFGGPDRAIRVLNRPSVSGTNKTFRTIVLGDGNFGTTPNITTLVRDATTPMLRMLGPDGIGYATYGQVADQQTVRVLPIDGNTPEAEAYPFQRPLFYAYREPPNAAAKAFLGFALSQDGQSGIAGAIQGP